MSVVVNILLYIGVLLVLLLAWINGANNAGNVVGVVVGARGISVKKALLLAFIFEVTGAMLLGHYISTTIMSGIIDSREIGGDMLVIGVVTIAFSAVFWMFIATFLRIPLSVTQAIVGGITGFGLKALGFNGIYWLKLIIIISSWPATLLISILLSLLLYRVHVKLISHIKNTRSLLLVFSILLYTCIAITLLIVMSNVYSEVYSLFSYSLITPLLIVIPYVTILKRNTRRDYYEAKSILYKHLLLVTSSLAAFSHGAHDVGGSAGLLQLLVNQITNNENTLEAEVSRLILLVSGFTIALGMLSWGYRVLGTLGERITPLTLESGFIAQLSSALTILLVTRLSLPSSTTLAITGAIVGVGLARGKNYINYKTIIKILTTWIVSFPATLLFSISIFQLLKSYF
jgi:PiT family inorganic phosphate transporter